MKRRMNEVNMRSVRVKLFFVIVPLLVVAVVTMSCGGDERRAERLWRQAIELVEKGDTQGAVDRLQRLIDTFPDSQVAAKAREQIVVYRGLATAVQNYPLRRARESMVQIARAIETFRREMGHPPATLDDLVPTNLAILPTDPWGRPFLYETTSGGYRLRYQGATGADAGNPESAGLLVVNGEFRVVTQ